MEKELEMRMYFLVPYNISDIQQGIQSGHSMGEYLLKYARYNPQHPVWDFLERHKTWIILNGGTTNATVIQETNPKENVYHGTLDNSYLQLIGAGIDCAPFIEPDLNNALSAVCFIADERVFNYEDYPEFMDFLLNVGVLGRYSDDLKLFKRLDIEERKEKYKKHYDIWVRNLGGEKNVFLRNLLKGKKLA